MTAGATAENRTGGTRPGAVLPDGSVYPFDLRTRRYDAGAVGTVPVGPGWVLTVRGSATRESLAHAYGFVRERDRIGTGYAEAAVAGTGAAHAWVAGAAFRADGLHTPDVAGFDYHFTTPGIFAQDTYTPAWIADSAVALTASARVDRHSRYGTFASPRLALLLHPSARGPLAALSPYTLRVSGGTGFFAPTPFTEETAPIGLAPLRPFDAAPATPDARLVAERARSADAALTARFGRAAGGRLRLRVHHRAPGRAPRAAGQRRPPRAGHPRRAESGGGRRTGRAAADGSRRPVRLLHVRPCHGARPRHGRRRDTPLNLRHAAGVDLLFEPVEGSRVGVEAFYTGRQALVDDPYRTESRPYVTVGLLAQYQLGRVQVFANAEDLTDVRQSRYDPLVLPRRGPGGRWTTDAWAPLDGRVLNVGVRVTTARPVARAAR